MKIRVKLFAILRERSGCAETELELPAGSTVNDAMGILKRQFPGIVDLLPRAATAVNFAKSDGATVLGEGDELALIPPVSGG